MEICDSQPVLKRRDSDTSRLPVDVEAERASGVRVSIYFKVLATDVMCT